MKYEGGDKPGAAIKLTSVFTLVWCTCCVVAASGLSLPPSRVYEMVSPVFKGGYGVNVNRAILAVAPDGENVAFSSLGSFAGDPADNPLANDYVAGRNAGTGWFTAPLLPPASIAGDSGVVDVSPNLDSTLDEVRLGPDYGRAKEDNTEAEYLLHSSDTQDTAPNAPDPGPNFEVAGMVLKDVSGTNFRTGYEGASADFSHIVFESPGGRDQQLLPEATKSELHLYDLSMSQSCGTLGSAVCAEESGDSLTGNVPSLRLVGLGNKGKAINAFCLASLRGGAGGQFNAVSADGSEVFFTTGVDGACAVPQLFVRLGGERTVEVSKPLLPKCSETLPCLGASARAPALFWGASENGSTAYFTTSEPLVPGDNDTSNNLYMARIGCPEGSAGCDPTDRVVTGLVQVSSDPNAGQSAEVRNVVAVAPDGSHIYFIASGDLLGQAEINALASEGHSASEVGADNLYVYDSLTEKVKFVADLCSGPGLSGEVADIECPSTLSSETGSNDARNDTPLWLSIGGNEAQLNVCARPSSNECNGNFETGRFLVFSSYAHLTPRDTDSGRDVYRFDAITGDIQRVSIGENGYDANGNGAFDASLQDAGTFSDASLFGQRNMGKRAVSEDGSRMVFVTAEPLSPDAGNGLSDAYEWDDGNVSLVSSGSSTRAVEDVVMSSSGNDIFFTTTQGLTSGDTDGQMDVYDARLGGGFLPSPLETQPCSGDACQGSLTNPTPLLVPGSVVQAPGENAQPVKTITKKKVAGKAKKKKGKAKRARRYRKMVRGRGRP